jgi:hypothetical protein
MVYCTSFSQRRFVVVKGVADWSGSWNVLVYFIIR